MASIQYVMPVLLVKDVSVSKEFYQDVFSLELENDFGEYIEFKNSFSIWQEKRAEGIIFNSKREHDPNNVKNVELYFQSNDIEGIWRKINEKSIEIIHGLKEEPWGQRTFRIFDPDKFMIEIAESMNDVILRLSKAGLSEKEISKKTQMSIEAVKKALKEKK